jgi:hypothetical protein
MDNEIMQGKPYTGMFGLDKLPAIIKFINFTLTVILGTVLAFFSWYSRLYDGEAVYQLSPFAWPLIFLFAWPICGLILWLRITGINWFLSVLAGIFVLMLYYVVHSFVYALGMFLS